MVMQMERIYGIFSNDKGVVLMLQLQPVMYKAQYLMLLERCFFECDVISFCLPIYSGSEFEEYKKKIKPLLGAFEPNLIHSEKTNCYAGQETEHLNEVYYYSTIGLSGEPFKMAESIYDWLYPDLPEDICFFKEGVCWFQSIAHEKLCFVYDSSKKTKDHLTWLSFNFIEDQNKDVPTIKI